MREVKLEQRRQAIERGVNFIYRKACNRKSFRHYAPYFVCCFLLIASTSRRASLRRTVREMGRDLARRWREARPALPAGADPSTLCQWMLAGCAADCLGLRDELLKRQLRASAGRFTVQDFLGFDPKTEPPPDNLPWACKCGSENPRGRKTCRNCKRRLTMMSRYRTWIHALGTTYWGERYGVRLAARYADVLRWLPDMHPYPRRDEVDYTDFFDIVYAITHVVYTLNGYGQYNLSPRWLPHEYAFLKANLKEAVALDDPDMVGEFLDSLKAFGLSDAHPAIRLGTTYLLSQQNPDGSWGDPDNEDPFHRFHATWAAIDGLREYAWRGERLVYPKLTPLLRQWAKSR